mgnify:CR=1 FL=1
MKPVLAASLVGLLTVAAFAQQPPVFRTNTQYVALEHGFSGRSMGALSVTANAHYRDPFGPLIPGVTFVAPDDVKGLEAAVTEHTAAIIAGENATPENIARIRTQVCASHTEAQLDRAAILFAEASANVT